VFWLHCCPSLPPNIHSSIIKIDSRFIWKDNFGPVFFWVPLCNSGQPPDPSTSIVRTNEWVPSGYSTVQRPATNPSPGCWLRNHFAYTRLTVPRDRDRCCCPSPFSTLSSCSVIPLGVLFIIGLLVGSWSNEFLSFWLDIKHCFIKIAYILSIIDVLISVYNQLSFSGSFKKIEYSLRLVKWK